MHLFKHKSKAYKLIAKSKFFDKRWYLKTYPDVAAAGIDPVEHFLKIGWREGRNPSIRFDINAYLNNNPDVAAEEINPLYHYELYGRKEKRGVYPVISITLSDTISYQLLKACRALGLISQRKFDLRKRRFVHPDFAAIYKSKYFDIDYYTTQHPEIKRDDALVHYLNIGFLNGFNPSKNFDNDAYFNQRPDILTANMNPLYHYEVAGKYEGVHPQKVGEYSTKLPTNIPSNSVLLISHEFSLTGAPIALLNLAKVLKRCGFFPIVLSPKGGELERDLQLNSIPYIIENRMFMKLYRSDLEFNSFLDKFKLIIFNTIDTLRFAQYINVARRKIMWVHEGEFGYSCAKSSFDIKNAFEHLDRVYSVGHYSKSFTDEYIPADKSDVLLYGIEELKDADNMTKKHNDKLTFGIFGVVCERKGTDIFVDAVKKLPKSIKSKCEFKVVGRIDNNAWTAKVLKDAEGEPIVFTDQMPHDQMMQEMYNTDVVVCSSLDDPMPIVCTEAMQLSRPVICSNHTGTASFIEDGKNSFLWNVEQDKLSDIFTKAYKNRTKLDEMGKAWNSIYVQNFTKDVFEARVSSILNSCLNNNAVDRNATLFENKKTEYDLIIPIGVSCHCSMLLRMMRLQNQSLAFDWSGHELHHINHDAILQEKIRLICADFDNFVQREDFVELSGNNNKHKHVINRRTGLHYFHDFPIDKTVEEHFSEFQETYTRRANRLLQSIKDSTKVAFVWMQDTWDQRKDQTSCLSLGVIKAQLDLLKAKFPNTMFDFLVFENDSSLPESKILTSHTNNIYRYISNHSILFDEFYSKKYGQYMVASIYTILSTLALKK